MPPPNNKAKHLGDARANSLIHKQKQTAIERTKERRRDAWAAMSDIFKENSDIMMNKKVRVRNLEETKVVLLVLYRELEISLTHCTADGDLYVTGLTEHTLFRHTSATLRMNWKEVRRIYFSFTSEETGQTLNSFRRVYDNSLQGKGGPNSKFHVKIPNSLCLHLIKYIDTKHAKGKKVDCREVLNWLQRKQAVYCSKHIL